MNWKVKGIVPKFSETPGEIKRSGPDPGAHNQEVYQGLFGLTPAEIEALKGRECYDGAAEIGHRF